MTDCLQALGQISLFKHTVGKRFLADCFNAVRYFDIGYFAFVKRIIAYFTNTVGDNLLGAVVKITKQCCFVFIVQNIVLNRVVMTFGLKAELYGIFVYFPEKRSFKLNIFALVLYGNGKDFACIEIIGNTAYVISVILHTADKRQTVSRTVLSIIQSC